MRILGIDPGSQCTGYGLVEETTRGLRPLAHGTIRPRGGLELPDRLLEIHRGVAALVAEHAPDVVAVETAFYHKSARSTLVLGHVRGVILLAAREAGIPVCEYAPREIKLAVTGSGGAAKEQVALLVRGLLRLVEPLPLDASDALAVAFCHWHRSRDPVAAALRGAPAGPPRR
jgi:crossover junction endodeoxyribonuclease RuvC